MATDLGRVRVEEIRRGPFAGPPAVYARPSARTRVQTVAKYLAGSHTTLGLAGFAGPLVSGNDDRLVNLRDGFLFGHFANNWLHSFLHVLIGLAGTRLHRTPSGARNYMRLHAGLFGAMAAAGWMRSGETGRVHHLMGMAVNRPDTILHTVLAVIGLWGARTRT